MHSIASNMVAIPLPQNLSLTVNVHIIIFVGAKLNVQDEDGDTPLKDAKNQLADTSNEEKKRCYQQVCECTYHTIIFHCSQFG